MDSAKKKESTACVYASRRELQIEPGINRFIIWDVQQCRSVSGRISDVGLFMIINHCFIFPCLKQKVFQKGSQFSSRHRMSRWKGRINLSMRIEGRNNTRRNSASTKADVHSRSGLVMLIKICKRKYFAKSR